MHCLYTYIVYHCKQHIYNQTGVIIIIVTTVSSINLHDTKIGQWQQDGLKNSMLHSQTAQSKPIQLNDDDTGIKCSIIAHSSAFHSGIQHFTF